jgi:hypothetical protein
MPKYVGPTWARVAWWQPSANVDGGDDLDAAAPDDGRGG